MKKRILIILSVSLMLTSLFISPAKADTAILVGDDALVDRDFADTNGNGYGLLVAYSGFPNFVITRRAYLRFDLSSLTANVGIGASIMLYAYNRVGSSSGNLELWSADDDWNLSAAGLGDETTLTWNTQPGGIALIATTGVVAANNPVYFTSAALANYINTQRVENGGNDLASFMIQWEDCTGSCLTFEEIDLDDKEQFGGSGKPPVLLHQGPTAVTLSDFTAEAKAGYNLVKWKTILEVNLVGFNLYRSIGLSGERVKLNSALLPAQALGDINGGEYDFIDDQVQPGTTYFYWLESVESTGLVQTYAPVSATSDFVFYLPLVVD